LAALAGKYRQVPQGRLLDMLDLKEMEKRLDDALAKETEESLTKWLLLSRFKNYLVDNGDGEFDFLFSSDSKLIVKSQPTINFKEKRQNIKKNYSLSEAA